MTVRRSTLAGEAAPLWLAVLLGLAGSASAAGAARIGLDIAGAPEEPAPLPTPLAPPPPAQVPAPAAAVAPPPSPPPPPQPSSPAPCPTVVLGFDRDSSETARPVVEEVRALAAWLRQHEDVTVVLDGHADAVGRWERNLALSHERAQRIAGVLRKAGIPARRITARGFGAYQPLEEGPADGPAQRRVEVHLRGATACFRESRRVVVP